MGVSRFRLLEALSEQDGRPCDGCPTHDYCALGYACGDFVNWAQEGQGRRPVKPGRDPTRRIYATLFPGDFAEVEDVADLMLRVNRARNKSDWHRAKEQGERYAKVHDELTAQLTAHKQREANRVSA